MNIDKPALFSELFIQLEKSFLAATNAAEGARQLATHEQSKPETQYDTVGLEASYLAHGHSQRAADLANAIEDWQGLQHKRFDEDPSIDAGALVEIIDSEDVTKHFLIGNYSGGLKLDVPSNKLKEKASEKQKESQDELQNGNLHDKQGFSVTVITLSSPLGRALKHKQLGDEIQHPVNKRLMLEVSGIS